MIYTNTQRHLKVPVTLIFAFLFAPFYLLAQDNYRIDGHMLLPDSTQIELGFPHSSIPGQKTWTCDGNFSFTGRIDGPHEILLYVMPPGQGVQARMLYLDSGRMELSGSSVLADANILHSPINDLFAEYKAIFQDPSESPADAQWKYIRTHPNSLFSVAALEDLSSYTLDHLDSIESIFEGLGPDVKMSQRGQAFKAWLVKNKTLAPGHPAPDLTVKDEHGKPLSFSAFRGKYVLVHFWASWCPGCRDEAPYFIDAYRKYADKNLQIVYVTLDDSAHLKAWKEAIDKDKVGMFTHTKAELPDVYRLFNITGIPLNFLIDPEGRIVMSDTGTEKIDRSLAPIFADRKG